MILRNISKVEAVGLLLLLFSFGWQIFEQYSYSLEQKTNLYQTHEKLDAIWNLISDDYSKKYQDEIASYSSTNFEHLLKNWKYWGSMEKEKESVYNQYRFAFKFRAILYILGSLLIIFPKLISDTKINAVSSPNEENN